MGEPFSHPLRVRYAECDPQGVVFNAHYLAYFDASITEMWRAAFGGYRAMMDRGIDLVVAEAQLRFRTPARFDDELTLTVQVTRMGSTAITSHHRISRGEELIVEGTLRHVVVSLETLAKTPIPDWIREGLSPWALEDAATPTPASPSAPA
jgi:acyl-CoA thioester hydrolase